MNAHWSERLSEFADGELSAADQAACEAHLAECEQCRALSRELQMVTEAARADEDRNPSVDLWPGILNRIERMGPPASVHVAEGDLISGRKQITFSLPQLALAASLLIAVSAGVSYVAMGRSISRPAPQPQEAPIQAMAESMMAPSADVTRANFADAQFDQAVADLELILVDQRNELDPRTVVIIERNLAVIDEAIRQARAALDADPANTFLNSHLADARRRKLDLLRRATSLASTSGD